MKFRSLWKVVRSLTVVIEPAGIPMPLQEFEACSQRPEENRADGAGIDEGITPLAMAIIALGAVYWLVRDQDRSIAGEGFARQHNRAPRVGREKKASSAEK